MTPQADSVAAYEAVRTRTTALLTQTGPEQVAAWDWTGEPAVERLCLLPARPTALEE